MEEIIVSEIRSFISREELVIEEQHGFTPGRSTITNLLLCLDKWTDNWNLRQPTDIV